MGREKIIMTMLNYLSNIPLVIVGSSHIWGLRCGM
jgi:hypothetical protein